jgi:hypothetical protein
LRIKYKKEKKGEYTHPENAFVSEYDLDVNSRYNFEFQGDFGPRDGTILNFSWMEKPHTNEIDVNGNYV